MKNKNVNFTKERLEMLLSHYNIKAPTFAKQIGVLYKRLLDIQNEKVKNISGELANKIVSTFPEISLSWLLTGVGEMFDKENEQKGTNIVYANTGGNLGHSADENNILQNLVKQKDEIIKSLQALVEQQQKIITKLSK